MLGPIAVLLLAAQAGAQAQRSPLSAAEVASMEAALKKVPRDAAIRSTLLEYYFRNRIQPAVAVPARRRHILWVIENAPESEIAYGPTVTIDTDGSLADPEGFQLASQAWRDQTTKPGVKPMALANAAYFFKLSDKQLALGLLKRALGMDTRSREIAARLGDEYALLILGVTMVNGSGYPTRNDPALTQSPLASQARDELGGATNPYVVAKAGYQLLWQGDVLYYAGKLPFDPQPLSRSTLEHAVSLAPGDKEIAALRAEYDKFQLEKEGRAPIAAPKTSRATPPPPDAAPAPPPAPAPVPPKASASTPAPVKPPPPPPVSVDDLKKVEAGMTRDQLLKLGMPTNRISLDEEGHYVEIYQYSANGRRLGAVRLQDGVVSSVRVP